MSVDKNKKLKDSKVCRVFISSPFNGMYGEREELRRRYWPKIQHLCKLRGVHFVPVDMRWGITTELSDNAQTINICLREIDRSDLFIGCFGQRYGWQGREDEALQRNFSMAAGKYPWLEDYRDRGVTELEFLHGHLNNPGKLPACICFRDKQYDDKMREEAERKGDTKMVYNYSSESDIATALMADLKHRVQETKDKCLAVYMDYKDPSEGAKLMFDAIWKHLNEVLLKDPTSQKLTQRQIELSQHDAFCETRGGLYVGADAYYSKLNQHLSNGGCEPVLILGEPGSGKSALLCNWIKETQKLQTNDILLYHFVGCAPGSISIKNILRRIVSGLKQRLKTTASNSDVTIDDTSALDSMDVRMLMSEWQAEMTKATDTGYSVTIVIDALNQIQYGGKTSKPLYWVPSEFPRGVRLIFSTRNSDEPRIDDLQGQRGYHVINIDELESTSRKDICLGILNLRGKTMSESQLQTVVDTEETKNPLFLTVALEELCMFGKFRELDSKINNLMGSKNTKELFEKYLERLELDYESKEYDGNLIERVMTALCVSRQGLTESELAAIFNIPVHIWSPLYFGLEAFLLNRSGFLSFGHDDLKDAVYDRYIKTDERRKKSLQIQVDYFIRLLKANEEIATHVRTETPWLCYQAKNNKSLLQLLTNVKIFETLLEEDIYSLLEYWQFLAATGEDVVRLYFQFGIDPALCTYYNQQIKDYYEEPDTAQYLLGMLDNLQKFLSFGHYQKAIDIVLKRKQKILETNLTLTKSFRERNLNTTFYDMACNDVDKKDCISAVDLYKKVIDYSEKCQDSLDEDSKNLLARVYHGIGTAYQGLNMLNEAEEVYKKSIKLHKELGENLTEHKSNIIVSLGMLAMVHFDQGNIEMSTEELEGVLKMEEDFYFGELPPQVSYTLTHLGLCYRHLEQYDKAEDYYNRAMKIKRNAYGWNHMDVAIGVMNLANLALDQKNWTLTEERYKKVLEIYQNIELGEGVDALRARENIAQVLIIQGKMEEAESYFWTVFDTLVAGNDLDKGLKFVHDNFLRHFVHTEKWEKARKILPAILRSKHAEPLYFYFLCRIDIEVGDMIERPYEESLDRAIELFGYDFTVTEGKIEYQLIPKRQLNELQTFLDKYMAESGDVTENLIMRTLDLCEKAEWKEALDELYETWLPQFADCEGLNRNASAYYFEKGDLEKSLQCLQRASSLNPDAGFLKGHIARLAYMH